MFWVSAGGGCTFFRLWRYWDRSCFDVWCIVEHLYDDARTLGRAVAVAIAVSAPFKHKGGGAHGRVMVFVATVDAIIESFKGTPKVWSRYWHSLSFRCGSGGMIPVMALLSISFQALLAAIWLRQRCNSMMVSVSTAFAESSL